MKTWYLYRKLPESDGSVLSGIGPSTDQNQLHQAKQYENYRLVPSGFSYLATLFGPLWLIVRAPLIGIIAIAIISTVAALVGWLAKEYGYDINNFGIIAMMVTIMHLLFGFNGFQLEEFSLKQRNYQLYDVIIARNLISAELRASQLQSEIEQKSTRSTKPINAPRSGEMW